MLTADGPMMIEYNIRFGDPETQVVVPPIDSDLTALLVEAASGQLTSTPTFFAATLSSRWCVRPRAIRSRPGMAMSSKDSMTRKRSKASMCSAPASIGIRMAGSSRPEVVAQRDGPRSDAVRSPGEGVRGRRVHRLARRSSPVRHCGRSRQRRGSFMKVAVLMGSPNDMATMQSAADTLAKFGIEADVRVMSATARRRWWRRSPPRLATKGYGALICGAGMAADLAGAVAAHTTLPVIGVPLSRSAPNGVDALYSTVQMPPGVPVATVAIDAADECCPARRADAFHHRCRSRRSTGPGPAGACRGHLTVL